MLPSLRGAHYRRRKATPALPIGPYLSVETENPTKVVIESQDGTNVRIRMIRPIWSGQAGVAFTLHNYDYANVEFSWMYEHPSFIRTWQSWRLIFDREVLTDDYGTYRFYVDFYNKQGGTIATLHFTVIVTDTLSGPVPAPFPYDRNNEVLFIGFEPGTWLGPLNNTYGNVWNTGNGTAMVQGQASAMTPPEPNGINDDSGGYGNGYYQYRVRFTGTDIGDGTGPALLLWPYDNKWPGSEIDLSEFFPAGSDGPGRPAIQYMAIHWKEENGTPEGANGDDIWAIQDDATIAPGRVWNPLEWHTYGALLLNDRVVLTVDDKVLADYRDHPAPDFRNGGVNHTIGFLCNSTDRGFEVEWIRWIPERLFGTIHNPLPSQQPTTFEEFLADAAAATDLRQARGAAPRSRLDGASSADSVSSSPFASNNEFVTEGASAADARQAAASARASRADGSLARDAVGSTAAQSVAVPVVANQSFSVPEGTWMGSRLHRVATTGGTPTGFVLAGPDAAQFELAEEGVVVSRFDARAGTKASYSFTAAGVNAAGTGQFGTISCTVVANGFLLDPLIASAVPANAPVGSQAAHLNYYTGNAFGNLSATSITSATHPGLFAISPSGEITVAPGASLPAGATVKLGVSATFNGVTDTGEVRITVVAAEIAPTVETTVMGILSGAANRILGSLNIIGAVRSTAITAQSTPGAFSLISNVGVMNNVAIAAGSADYWIDVTATNYGGTSPVKRITLSVSAGPGAKNNQLPEDAAGPVAGSPSL